METTYPDWSKKVDPEPKKKITSLNKDAVLLFSSKQIDSLITYMEALEAIRDAKPRGCTGSYKIPRDIKNCNKYIDAWFKAQAETGKTVFEIEFELLAEPEYL